MIGAITAGLFSDAGAPASTNSFESIQTVTVGSGGQSSISFTSIPSTYKHLQIRIFAKTSRAGQPIDGMNIQFNGDTASNYSQHWIQGDGSTASAFGYASQTRGWLGMSGGATGNFSANIVDILDYTSTTKNKTHRYLAGEDANGSGLIELGSGVWLNSSTAISSITILPDYANYVQYSSFALYGVRG